MLKEAKTGSNNLPVLFRWLLRRMPPTGSDYISLYFPILFYICSCIFLYYSCQKSSPFWKVALKIDFFLKITFKSTEKGIKRELKVYLRGPLFLICFHIFLYFSYGGSGIVLNVSCFKDPFYWRPPSRREAKLNTYSFSQLFMLGTASETAELFWVLSPCYYFLCSIMMFDWALYWGCTK